MEKVWIARDKSGSLYAFKGKPRLCSVSFFIPEPGSGECLQLNRDSFPEVTYENSPLPLDVMLDYGK